MRGRPRKDEREARTLKLKIPSYRYERNAPSVMLIWGRYPVSDNPRGVSLQSIIGLKKRNSLICGFKNRAS